MPNYKEKYRELISDRTALLSTIILFLSVLLFFKFFNPTFTARQDVLSGIDLDITIIQSAGSNLFNQLRWLVLAGLASLLVLSDPKRFLTFCNLSWLLIAMCALSVMSVTWSIEPEATLRRAIRMSITMYVLMVAVAYAPSARHVLLVVYCALFAALLQNLAGFAIPKTFDMFGFYTGATSQKNQLGLLAAVAVLLWMRSPLFLNNPWRNPFNLFFGFAWLALLVLSGSKTSMGLIVIIPALLLGLTWVARTLKSGIGFPLTALICIAVLSLGFIYVVLGLNYRDLLDILISKQFTFTGRTYIWEFMAVHIADRPVLGYGFGTFWGAGSDSPSLTASHPFIQYLKSAHNGYLDLLASMGLVGVTLFVCLMVHITMTLARIAHTDLPLYYACWLFHLLALFHNMMESSYFKGSENAMWLSFLVATLIGTRALVAQTEGEPHRAAPEPSDNNNADRLNPAAT